MALPDRSHSTRSREPDAGARVELVAQRYADARGETVIIAEDDLNFVEYLEFRAAGDVRGGHWHDGFSERLYVIAGALDAELASLDGGAFRLVESMRLEAGMTLTIPPTVAHRFTACEPASAIAFGLGTSPLRDRHLVDDWPAGTSG